jgi:hypothetical protein
MAQRSSGMAPAAAASSDSDAALPLALPFSAVTVPVSEQPLYAIS